MRERGEIRRETDTNNHAQRHQQVQPQPRRPKMNTADQNSSKHANITTTSYREKGTKHRSEFSSRQKGPVLSLSPTPTERNERMQRNDAQPHDLQRFEFDPKMIYVRLALLSLPNGEHYLRVLGRLGLQILIDFGNALERGIRSVSESCY